MRIYRSMAWCLAILANVLLAVLVFGPGLLAQDPQYDYGYYATGHCFDAPTNYGNSRCDIKGGEDPSPWCGTNPTCDSYEGTCKDNGLTHKFAKDSFKYQYSTCKGGFIGESCYQCKIVCANGTYWVPHKSGDPKCYTPICYYHWYVDNKCIK